MKEFIAFLFFGLGCLVLGGVTATSSFKSEAIKAGVAEYQVDKKTGETKFVFLSKNIEKLEK